MKKLSDLLSTKIYGQLAVGAISLAQDELVEANKHMFDEEGNEYAEHMIKAIHYLEKANMYSSYCVLLSV